MKTKILRRGFICHVSDCDAHLLEDKSITAYRHGRSSRIYCVVYENGKRKRIPLANKILIPPKGFLVDHVDGNGFNNCRYNLRISDFSGNSINRRKRSHHKGIPTKSAYKGVSTTRNGKWITRVIFHGKVVFYKRFSYEKEAAEAYQREARKLFGEFYRPD